MAIGATRRLAALALATALAATACAHGGWPGGRGPPRPAVPGRDRPDADHRPHHVRPARRRPLPAAVPQRPLHGGRRRHADRPARRPGAERHARQPVGRPRRPHRAEPQRRLLARLGHRRAAPGARPGAPAAWRPITDIGASLDRDAPIVIVDADTGERHPYWAELDSRAPDPAHQLLFVRPARNFLEGHRYVVALRGVVDGAGQPIAPDRRVPGLPRPPAHRRARGRGPAGPHGGPVPHARDAPASDRREPHRWRGTSPSPAARTCPSASSPCATTPSPASATPLRPSRSPTSGRARGRTWPPRCEGTFQVPSYLTGDGAPGAVLNNGDGPGSSPIPERNGDVHRPVHLHDPALGHEPRRHRQPDRA